APRPRSTLTTFGALLAPRFGLCWLSTCALKTANSGHCAAVSPEQPSDPPQLLEARIHTHASTHAHTVVLFRDLKLCSAFLGAQEDRGLPAQDHAINWPNQRHQQRAERGRL